MSRARGASGAAIAAAIVLLMAVAGATAAPPNQPQLDNASVMENQPAGTVVGTLSTTDPDPGETFTYKLVAGTGDTGNGSFKIVGDKLTTRVSLDYETQSAYSIRVRVEDSHGERNRSVFAIQVTDNPADNPTSAPTNIKLSNHTVTENEPAETVVGTLTATDADPGDTFMYRMAGGAGSVDNALFHIVGDQLKTKQRLDHEVKADLLIRVQVTDAQAHKLVKVFSITVGNVQEIAFASYRDGAPEIYVMNADGTNQTRLTNNTEVDFQPAFSSDGTKIAFTSERDALGSDQIYVMNADGTNQTRLTNNAAFDFEPAFSPDGTRIAFTSTRDGGDEIYVMDADGTDQTRLTNSFGGDSRAAFSPDGSKIAFDSSRDGNPEIYVMNADGTNQTRLTNNGAGDFAPAFSPDGTQIAFTSLRDGNYEIYVMNADGTNQTNLTNNTANDLDPAFSRDGAKIAFTSDRDANFEVYVMNADGTNQTRLTNNTVEDSGPSWSP